MKFKNMMVGLNLEELLTSKHFCITVIQIHVNIDFYIVLFRPHKNKNLEVPVVKWLSS